MTPEIKALIAILIGLVLCFSGYKIQKLVITLAWFLIGATLTKYVGSYFIANNNLLLLIQIIVGIILGSVGFKLEKLALFIAVSYLVFITIGPYITGMEEGVNFIIQGGIALLIGALSTFFIKPILIVVSSLAGANIIKSSLPLLINLSSNILTIIIIVIAFLGILVQFKNK